ncbi:hypothetical protein ACF3NG_02175 [Aerococcaceae bacterium WGS1372]
MLHRLTIQEAIFILSNFNKEVERINRQFYSNFFGPVAVDGKAIPHTDKATNNLESLEAYQNLVTDISHLRQAINLANGNISIDGKPVSYQLEWIRLQRQLINQLEQLLERSETRVENGVGVVDYRPYAEADIRLQIEQLTKKVNQISSKIDQSNATTTIELQLLTDI